MEHSCNISVVVIEHSSVTDIDIAGLPQRGISLEWSVDYSTVLGYTDWGNTLSNGWSVSDSMLELISITGSILGAELGCLSKSDIVNAWGVAVISVCLISCLVTKAHVEIVCSGSGLISESFWVENVVSVM